MVRKSDVLLPPQIIKLDSCKPPKVFIVPNNHPYQNKNLAKSNKHFSKLLPPDERIAGFCSQITSYDAEQGLYAGIYCITKDAKGRLWFGTAGGGAICYDGKTFINFNTAQGLAGNIIPAIAFDSSERVWIGTYHHGLSCYDGKKFTTYTTLNGLGSNDIRSIAMDHDKNLWVATTNGASMWCGNNFKTFTVADGLTSNKISKIFSDRSGTLWIGTGAGLNSFDGKKFQSFTTKDGLCGNMIRCVSEDNSGNLWIGTEEGGISCYDRKTFRNFNDKNGPGASFVNDICIDRFGLIWIGTRGRGVYCYDGHNFTNYSVANGLANNYVNCITEDNDGGLWIGTYGGGASRFNGRAFTTYTTKEGLTNNVVIGITQDKSGNLWFASDGGGASRYNNKTFTTFSSQQGLVDSQLTGIAVDRDGNVWFGSPDYGVCFYDGKKITTYTTAQGLVGKSVGYIFQDKNGRMWFGTSGGVSCFDGATFKNFTTDQGLPSNSVNTIQQDESGNMWFGTYGGGVSCYKGNSFVTYTDKQGLCNNSIISSCMDKHGNFWFGSDGGGVSRFDGKTFMTFTTTDGLSDNVILGCVEDKNNKLWFGTNIGLSGLLAFKKRPTAVNEQTDNSGYLVDADNDLPNSELLDNYVPVFEKYNFKNGFPVKDVNINAVFVDSNGIIWAGTGNKLVRFDYSELYKNKQQPYIYINGIKIGGENIGWNTLLNNRLKTKDTLSIYSEEISTFGKILSPETRDSMLRKFGDIYFDSIAKFYPVPVELHLPYRHNSIMFEFGAVETANPYLVNYQYKLQGYDKDWSPLTNRTSATFGNIREGTYTFMVKAQSPQGIWSEPLLYTFKVLPPVYRTWWAYLTYFIFVIISIYQFIRWRTKKLLKEKESLELIVAERTAQVVAEKAEIERKNIEIADEKKRSDELLLNILPEEIAEELKVKGTADAKLIDEVTVLFTDFKGFTQLSEKLSPKALVSEINECFSAFDLIMQKYNIEKIKTIGDSYMAAGGLPTPNKTHPHDVVKAALEIQAFMSSHKEKKEALGEPCFEIRIGIHTGPVVAGIVGIKKFAYDIWGDSVNIASRMESSCEVGKVNISETTYNLVKEKFKCEYRGEIEAKNKGRLKMYYISEPQNLQ
jgi:ligand-binding sensor domain-containing protein/class 3 adenylate cyclase